MNSQIVTDELSSFSTALRAFLKEKHPEINDEKFIKKRSSAALRAYVKAVRGGETHFVANEIANSVLYSGLRFSKFDLIFEIVSEWFPEVQRDMRNNFCLSILVECDSIFEMYDLSDDFETTSRYSDLQLELTGFIQYKIETDGI